ncbi:hypothetical protein P7K49_030034 [Saguinus oedipus]|uniref:Uncharacterized protein n=1 Tax=Saguinus oedipus TaxID=9490 RepID=A0ABQ9U1V5_SAGOE|nr:hypothetical protein P7K49_030034 [Saguinus oedipus]
MVQVLPAHTFQSRQSSGSYPQASDPRDVKSCYPVATESSAGRETRHHSALAGTYSVDCRDGVLGRQTRAPDGHHLWTAETVPGRQTRAPDRHHLWTAEMVRREDRQGLQTDITCGLQRRCAGKTDKGSRQTSPVDCRDSAGKTDKGSRQTSPVDCRDGAPGRQTRAPDRHHLWTAEKVCREDRQGFHTDITCGLQRQCREDRQGFHTDITCGLQRRCALLL